MNHITHNQRKFDLSELRDSHVDSGSNSRTSSRSAYRDPRFGDNGEFNLSRLLHIHPLDPNRYVEGCVVLNEDKLLISASLSRESKGLYGLIRLKSDGKIDTTFADNGLASGNLDNSDKCGAGKIAVQESGHIIMLGWLRRVDDSSPKKLVITRFEYDGSIDRNFGVNGHVLIDNSHFDELDSDSCSLHLLRDGKVLVSANYKKGNISTGLLIQIDSKGNLDTTFNQSGQLEIKNSAFISTLANALIVQSDGQILVAGGAQRSESETEGYVARYSAAGVLDVTFGKSGIPGFSLLRSDADTVIFHTLLATIEDKVVGIGQIIGNQIIGKRSWAMLVGFDSNGEGYPEFNNGNPVLTSFSEELGSGWFNAHLQTDGKILCVGGPKRLYMVRYHANGAIDRGFGQNGLIEENSALLRNSVCMRTQADYRIILSANTNGAPGVGKVLGYKP